MLTLLLALSFQAAPAAETPAAEPPIAALAKAFSGCVREKLPAVPATLSAEAGADHVLKACEAQRAAIESEVEKMTAGAPPAEKEGALKEYRQAMVEARTALVGAIEARRKAAASAR